ncbi:MAG: peptidoglycan DD-metalloendopeptidase family protein [Candidatus Pacebacteria bacterium]|nr:peptidoglycan DD-metalloendopeptidase family protein [Candidatus Paceibacterota bacterium]
MKTKFLVSAVSFLLAFSVGVSPAFAVIVNYQPTPYPLLDKNGNTMSQDLDKVHLWDGWLPSYYYNQEFTRDDKLQLGGWGDQYRIYVKFDIEGLPYDPDDVIMFMKSFDRGDSSTTTPFAFCQASSSWDLSLTWNTQPSFSGCWGWYSAPTPGDWWGRYITSMYSDWKDGTSTNYGVMMYPQNTNNNFNVFRSSRYSTESYRAVLQFYFTPTIEFKMPLPGNHTWLVTTETGGWDCKGDYDQYHDSTNYFSLDFSWRNQADAGAAVYDESTDDIPVLVAGGGKVYQATYSSYNGYYVVIDHDGDGNINTGVSTRYLHLKENSINVSVGETVQQGDRLGYMGDTGDYSDGVHLHFGVRYQDSGSSSVNQLSKVTVDGQILKGYQTKCSESNGIPTDWIRYYRSYNTAY